MSAALTHYHTKCLPNPKSEKLFAGVRGRVMSAVAALPSSITFSAATKQGGEISGGSEDEVIEVMIARERAWLVDWVENCEHTTERSDTLARLDEGSEHIVYFEPGGSAVFKLTKPGIYGDSYYLVDDRVHQRCCTPGDYLVRLELLQRTFGFAPNPVGVTKAGQIVSVQRFVEGEPPTQAEVTSSCCGKASSR